MSKTSKTIALQTIEPVSDLRRFMYHNAISKLIKFDMYQRDIER